jgi:2'-5' RNA ligase
MPRLFFALQPAAEQGAALLANLETSFGAQRVVAYPASKLHATLCFLGSIDEARLPALLEAAARVRCGRVSLRFDALEYWDKPRILCATASPDGVVGADVLASAISDEVVRAGFSPDLKPFRPHLTLARKVRAAQAEALGVPRTLQPGFVVLGDEFVLMESRRDERGSVYAVVDRWALA